MQYIGYGGWQAKRETYHKLRTRTNYYRETYAYGDRVAAPGVEQFLHYDKLIDAAHQVYSDCGILDPYIVFANILVPGQELSVLPLHHCVLRHCAHAAHAPSDTPRPYPAPLRLTSMCPSS